MTAREAITGATLQLEAVSPPDGTAQRDALLLLLHTLNITRAQFYAEPNRPLTPAEQSSFTHSIQRRVAQEPIQYITGHQEFYGLDLLVTPAVLIPRPETEHLVEAVLAELDPAKPLRILDIGTGSGAIAIALAHHLPQAHITAVDLSPVALEIAAANAARHHLTHRIRFLESDLVPGSSAQTAFTREARREQYEVLISNPPYIPTIDRDALHPQVRDHEPSTALFAGPDGLDIYRRLVPQAFDALKPNGLLALEIGHGQRDAIAALLANWHSVRFVDDLQHIPRVALARKP
jgi:release factor glutamine methyltransferase